MILNGACGGDKKRIQHFMELLNTPDQLVAEFRKIIENTDVFRTIDGSVSMFEASEIEPDQQVENKYKFFVWNLLDKNKHIENCREAVVLFLAALEYRKKMQPEANFYLCENGSFCCDYHEEQGRFAISLQTNKRKYPHDFKKNYFTSRHIVDREYYQIHVSSVAKEDDRYTFLHEFMHMVAVLCGFSATKLSLMGMLQNPLISNILNPHFVLTDNLKHGLIDQYIDQLEQATNNEIKVKNLLDKLLEDALPKTASQEIQNIIKPKLQSIKEMIESSESFFTQTKFIDIKKTAEGFQKFYDVMSAMVDYACERCLNYSWQSPEELSRILGMLVLGKCLIINKVSDLDYLVKLNELVRVSHNADVSNMKFKTLLLAKLGPKEESLKLLFSLHDLNYDDYKQKMQQKTAEIAKKKLTGLE